MTILVGQLLLQAVRFTAPSPGDQRCQRACDARDLADPSGRRTVVESGRDRHGFLDFAGGRRLVSTEPSLSIRPWTPATEFSRGRLVDGMVELPTICGDHLIYYPALLAAAAITANSSQPAIRGLAI